MHSGIKVELDAEQVEDIVKEALVRDYKFMIASKQTMLFTQEEIELFTPAFLTMIEYYGGVKALEELSL